AAGRPLRRRQPRPDLQSADPPLSALRPYRRQLYDRVLTPSRRRRSRPPMKTASQRTRGDASVNDINTVLFDLDGTLIDTAPDMARAWNDVLLEEGRPPIAFEAIRPHVSHGSTGLLNVAYGPDQPTAERERLRARFLDRYHADLA